MARSAFAFAADAVGDLHLADLYLEDRSLAADRAPADGNADGAERAAAATSNGIPVWRRGVFDHGCFYNFFAGQLTVEPAGTRTAVQCDGA